MQVVEPTDVMWLLCAFATTAAVFTGLGWAIARRRRRRVRGFFIVGVLFGMLAGPILQRRSRRLRALRAATRGADRFAARVFTRADHRLSSRR